VKLDDGAFPTRKSTPEEFVALFDANHRLAVAFVVDDDQYDGSTDTGNTLFANQSGSTRPSVVGGFVVVRLGEYAS
jgi:hypothetical protein